MWFEWVPSRNKSSWFLLNPTVKHHLVSFPESPVLMELHENCVDDWLSGTDSDAEAYQMFTQALDLMSKANFSLAKWMLNSQMFAGEVSHELGTPHLLYDSEKILGINWCASSDTFSFSGMTVPDNLLATKQVILSFTA